jgi:carboxymethylenebutenolidase
VVASYGGRDLMGDGHPKRLEAALTTLDVPHEVKVYPKAGHSFMSPKPAALKPVTMLARLDYNPEAAEDAWRRILAFFGQYLS